MLDAHDPPEITVADLVPLALDLASWGDASGSHLSWLDPPPRHALEHAQTALRKLGVLDAANQRTPHGAAVAALPLHPRLAHALCDAVAGDAAHVALGCTVVALLGERDIVDDSSDADLARRVEALAHGGHANAALVARVRDDAARLRRLLGIPDGVRPAHLDAIGTIVARVYPDRIARRRGDTRRYALANGIGGVLGERDNLATSEWLAVADIEVPVDGGDAPIRLAAPLTERDLESLGGVDDVIIREWDRRARDVRIASERRIGHIVLSSSPIDDRDAALDALVEGVRIEGLGLLPRRDEAAALRDRVAFCRRHLGDEWPDLGDEALAERLDEWLRPALVVLGARRAKDLARLDVGAAIRQLLPWSLRARLDDLAPTHVATPNGRQRTVDYTNDDPVVSVRLQDTFGWRDTPRLAGGRVPIVLSLLSPADRPVQITRDLAGFWTGSYAQVRAELRGRYPKHRWPEDPTSPQPGSGPPR